MERDSCPFVLPYLLFGLVIGAWVDRMNRKRLMVLTDLARALVIASIPLASVVGLLGLVDLRRSISQFRPHDLL